MGIRTFLSRHLLKGEKLVQFYRKQGVQIGKDCELYNTVHFGSEPYLITLGNHVRVTHGIWFITHDGGYWVLRDKKSHLFNRFKNSDHILPIVVKDNVHIGINSIIMPGVTIGENSVVACGAVVTHNVPPNSIVWGGGTSKSYRNPGRVCAKSRGTGDKYQGYGTRRKETFPYEKIQIAKFSSIKKLHSNCSIPMIIDFLGGAMA